MALILLLTASAFAATQASLTLQSPISVNGSTLKPGDYKLQWEGNGPNVEVSVIQGKTVLAKLPAKVVDLNSPAAYTAAVVKKNDDGTNSLVGARFQGKKFALEMGQSSVAVQTGSAN
jgi:hypothetical protein